MVISIYLNILITRKKALVPQGRRDMTCRQESKHLNEFTSSKVMYL